MSKLMLFGRIGGLAILCGMLSAAPVASAQPTTAPVGRWSAVGPSSLAPITDFALASGWPDEGVLLVVRGTQTVVRTTDGGSTWQSFAGPRDLRSGSPRQKLVIANSPSARLAFVGGGLSDDNLLYRSTDDGATWQVVLTRPDGIPRYANAQLVLSPAFAADGLAFALIGALEPLAGQSALARSTDGGATWSLLDPAPGRWLRDVVFSPTFGVDDTILLLTSKLLGEFPRTEMVSASTDVGNSWTALSDELSLDMGHLVPSPDLVHDGIMLATVEPAVVRSDDGGVSWRWAGGVAIPPSPTSGSASITLGPRFSQDGVALVASNQALGHGGPACGLQRTTDGGATWTSVTLHAPPADEVASRLGCSGVRLLSGPRGLVGLLNVGTFGWLWSDNAGLTWRILATPDGQPAWFVAPSPTFPADATLYVTTAPGSGSQRLWAVDIS